MSTPSVSQLKQAIGIAEEIEKLQSQLAHLLGSGASIGSYSPASVPSKGKRGGKRTMSPQTIAKMKAAQQARWAKKKGAAPGVVSPVDMSKKFRKQKGITPEGRAKLAAAMKARWAAKKKAAK